tara:strand:- start:1003 stop:1659 length:657 start_codon:yes stop_codon:yes gene_type:complete
MKSLSNLMKSILINNKLINGRLNMSISDMQMLLKSKQKINEKLQNELEKEEKKIKEASFKIKKIKLDLRKNQETLQKAFDPPYDNISLLYKKVGKNKYVKARFYWHGQQREVQIGSFKIILSIIEEMVKAGYLKNIEILNPDQLTWEEFNQNNKLVMATKQIAALKFQEYVLRKILNENNEKNMDEKKEVLTSFEIEEKLNNNDEKYDWYEKWREENL